MQKLDGFAVMWVMPSPRCDWCSTESDRYEEGSPSHSDQPSQCMVFARDDMTITHQEADTMIIQQVTSVGAANILIVPDDT